MRVRISGFDAARVSPRNRPDSRRLSHETLEWTLLSATERDGLEIWHPYALLHHLKKPVDLLTVNAAEHVITGSGRDRLFPSASVRFWTRCPMRRMARLTRFSKGRRFHNGTLADAVVNS